MNKLRERWGLENNNQVWLVLLVFALTGTTVMVLKRVLFKWSGLNETEYYKTITVAYYILVLPIYQGLLLVYGYLFGLHSFFWEKEKRLYARIKNLFVRHKKEENN